MTNDTYKLNEIRDMAGVTPRTVYFYIQKGLLHPPGTRGRRARYDRSHLRRLELIRRLQEDEHLPLRPDTLTDDDAVTEYAVHPSPIRSPVFDAGSTSRANGARFMADLIADEGLWARWRGQMPVVYDGPGGSRG